MNLCQIAHLIFQNLITPGDVVIDATVGNGHDLMFLARCLEGSGELHGYDIQKQALEESQKKILTLPKNCQSNIFLHQKSHEHFDLTQAKLIIYNLGYLPKGDKTITTMTKTTLASLEKATQLLLPQGTLSVMCYPGHLEGKKEFEEVKVFFESLEPCWKVTKIHPQRHPDAPCLFLGFHRPAGS